MGERMNKDRLEYFAHLVIAVAGITALAYLALHHLFLAIAPFLIGWFAAFASRGPAARLSEKTRLPEGVWRILIAVLFIVLLVLALVMLGRLLFGELWSLLSGLGEGGKLGEALDRISDEMLGIFSRLDLPREVEESISGALSGIVTSLLSSVGGALTTIASAIPGILLFLVITVISTVYFTVDLERINAAVRRSLPPKAFSALSRIKDGALTLVSKYLRSYFIIMLTTFVLMLVGLWILRVKYALLFAVILSLLDLLPVVGVGTALVPAGVFCFVSGNRGLAIGLIALFLVNLVWRQLAEPKILGKNLGVHPLVTLAAVYVGYSIFGFLGILLLPLGVVLLGIYKEDATEVGKSGATK